MPTLILDTNVPEEKFPADFLQKMTTVMAETIGKPECYISIMVHSGLKMSFGGTTEPCGNAQVFSIGKLGEKENPDHSAKISAYLKESLGISSDRMYIVFNDIDKVNGGYKGTTFATMTELSKNLFE